MFKNQLQELAQRSCFNLPAYACIREGPDHAPRFKATVNFNGEIFESPNYCNTLRQAEHAAAEVALNTLSRRGPSQSLAARILDETSVCKNLLQETAQRAGVSLPVYTTIRSGPGHLPVFTCMVEVAGMSFTGEAAKTKKQAEKNAAMAAWSALRLFANQGNSTLLLPESEVSEEQEQNTIARALARAHGKEEKLALGPSKQQLQHVGRLQVQRTVTGSPSRMRSIPGVREPSAPMGAGGVKQYHPGNWLPTELSMEPVQSQSQSYLYNQPHSSMIVGGGLPYRSVTAYPGQVSTPSSVRYLSGLSREALAANRAAAGQASNASRVIPTQLRSVPMTNRKDKHEVSIPMKEHQQDEDEWLHGGSVKFSAAEGDIQETSRAHLASSSNTPFNTTMWSHTSDPWWNYRSSQPSSFMSGHLLPTGASLAPPVRVRSVTAVCAAPPRASLHQVESEQAVSNDPIGDKDKTCEVFSQLRL